MPNFKFNLGQGVFIMKDGKAIAHANVECRADGIDRPNYYTVSNSKPVSIDEEALQAFWDSRLTWNLADSDTWIQEEDLAEVGVSSNDSL